MTELLIHPKTRRQTEAFVNKPAHAILLVGPSGSGKSSLARQLGAAIIGIEPEQLEKFAYAKLITHQDSKIGIDTIRELERFVGLKVPKSAPVNRLIIISDSDSLTLEAQNALLKLLEEPPESTVLILTSKHAQALLPTIRSRVQTINIHMPEKAKVKEYFTALNHDQTEVERAYSISGGLPGLMSSILNDQNHKLSEATEWARRLLSQSTYQRLLCVDELAKQKDLAIDITSIMRQMAHLSLLTSDGKNALKWRSILGASYEAGEQLNCNSNTKLVLTKLMLSL